MAYNQALKLTPHNTLYNKALALIGVAIQKEKPDFETLREALKCFDNVLAINPQGKNAPNMMTSGTR